MLQINAIAKDLYKPSDDLLAAINTALFLQRPLLLSGEPGTGKTECADFVARQLKIAYPKIFKEEKALRFNTKSISQSTDLFYQYDAVGHFGDRDNKPKESFISFNGLGVALLKTQEVKEEWMDFRNYKSDVVEHGIGYGSVVLVDEIDKAPRDFPNDLLAELEKPPFKFNIKELNEKPFTQNAEKPIVIIITSNNEKGLPDAFLRRCVFHHINFPGPEVLMDIIKSKLVGDDLPFAHAIDMFLQFRNMKNINKPPATSELIDWISCLKENNLLDSNLENWNNATPEYRERIIKTLGVIAKNKADFKYLKDDIAGK